MKKYKLLVGLMSCMFLTTTWVLADSTDVDSDGLLDAYLEDEARTVTYPSSSTAANQNNARNVDVPGTSSGTFVGNDGIEYRRIESVDGSEIYEAVPAGSANTESAAGEVTTLPEVVIANESDVQNIDELEVIELESADGEYVQIEEPQSASVANTNSQNSAQTSGDVYCQQNPYARECLLAEYATRCKKDPQSSDCKTQLEKFDRFCGTFPRAYKCKKAELAATCKEQPNLSQCKPFAERYCQRFPKAVFCNYN